MAVTASRLLDDGVDARRSAAERGVPGSRIDTIAAFHMATLGGANLLGIDAGLLSPGRWFDAFVVRLDRPGSSLRMWDGLDDEARVFDKIVHLCDRTDICSVWVAGRAIEAVTPNRSTA
jgi:guanine deaminase